MLVRIYCYAVCLLLLALCTRATAASSHTLQLNHQAFSTPLKFTVSLPEGYEKSGKHYPVLFDFHPRAHAYLSGIHDWLSHNGQWPWLETIIVTPDYHNPVGRLFDASGKTTPLLDFFSQQLFAELDKQYRTHPFRIISGFRKNGSVALAAMLRKPDLFNAYIVTSPELADNFAGLQTALPDALSELSSRPQSLFLAFSDSVKEQHQQGDYQQLVATLKQHRPEQLELTVYDFRHKHTFMALPLITLVNSIEALFSDIYQGLPADSSISRQGAPAIISHYQFLSEQKYGFTVSPKKSIQNLANAYRQHTPEKSIRLYKVLQQMYPDDAYSYHNLAAVYAATGDVKQAITYQQRAVEKGKTQLDWHQKQFKQALVTYLQQQEQAKMNPAQ